MGRHGAPKKARGTAGGQGPFGRNTVLGIAGLVAMGVLTVVSLDPGSAGQSDGSRRAVTGAARSVVPPLPSPSSTPDPSPTPAPRKQDVAKSPGTASGGGSGRGSAAVAPAEGGGPAGKAKVLSGREGGAVVKTAPREKVPQTAAAAAGAAGKLINEARAVAGCQPLAMSPALVVLAVQHSKDMALDGYFGHRGPDGATLWQRAARSGAAGTSAENIARGPADPQALLNMWMAQPGSRSNIVDCGLHTMGLGAFFNGSGFWWTGDFAV